MQVHRLVAANGSTVTHASGSRQHQAGEPGQSVSTSVVLAGKYLEGLLPEKYSVTITQACVAHVVHKIDKGFVVVLSPRDADAAIAAGSFDYTVHG
jgi:hypothetical protein